MTTSASWLWGSAGGSRLPVAPGVGSVEPGSVTMQQEQRIIVGCLSGQQDAWRALVQYWQPHVVRQMWRFSRDRRVCEELAQEVFVEVFRSLRRYKPGPVPFEHWLRRIATRVGYQFWKRQKRIMKPVPVERLALMAAPQEVEPAEAGQLLHDLLATLPPSDRLVLTLHYLEECSFKDIAQRTGWNVAMVKMRAWRARGRLRNLLEKRGGAELLGKGT